MDGNGLAPTSAVASALLSPIMTQEYASISEYVILAFLSMLVTQDTHFADIT